MTIKDLLNAIEDELEGAGTTHLSAATVYRGPRRSWRTVKSVFVIWGGSPPGEEFHAIGAGASISDVWYIYIDILMPEQDPTGAISRPEQWYDDFLELTEEVKAVLITAAARRMTVGSDNVNTMHITGVDADLADYDKNIYLWCRYTLAYDVPQV